MARNDRKSSETGKKTGGSRADARRSHSIRFADSEWRLIEKAASRQGIPAGEFARSGALAAAEERIGEAQPATLSPGHLALIESTWRMAYVLATLNREQLLDADRENDLDELVTEAREVMQETMTEGPALSAHDTLGPNFVQTAPARWHHGTLNLSFSAANPICHTARHRPGGTQR